MGEVEQRQSDVASCLGSRGKRLSEGGLLLGELCDARLAVIDKRLEARHLHGVDSHLALSHIGNLHVVEDLHVCLSHLHADIVSGFLQILCGSFEVELSEFDGVGDFKPRKQRHGGRERQRGATGIAVGIGILHGQSATEGERFACRRIEVGQAAVLRRMELYRLLAALVALLTDADIVCHGIVGTFAERPLAL